MRRATARRRLNPAHACQKLLRARTEGLRGGLFRHEVNSLTLREVMVFTLVFAGRDCVRLLMYGCLEVARAQAGSATGP